MAECHDAKNPNAVKEKHRKLLIDSLAACRFGDDFDVTLVCGKTEFPAHKLVLGAVSPYFKAMFRSGLDESNSGKVVFKDITPETLEFVLDFIYLGETGKIKNHEHAFVVMKVAHMMQLHLLTEYCCNTLLGMITTVNFHELWNVAELYEDKRLSAQVLVHVTENLNEVINTPSFLLLSAEQLEGLLNFCQMNGYSVDVVLSGILKWVRYNVYFRAEKAAKLLRCANTNLVTKQCLKSLLEDENNRFLPLVIVNSLKDIALTKFFTEETFTSGSGPSSAERPNTESKMDAKCMNKETDITDKFSFLQFYLNSCIAAALKEANLGY